MLLAACATHSRVAKDWQDIDTSRLPEPDIALSIPGMGPCTDSPDRTIRLNSHRPVTVLVHGCAGSSGVFRSLAQVHAFQGQQTACFSYNDRDSLVKTSGQLRTALADLSAQMKNSHLVVIGHSQGGLISRRALVSEAPKSRMRDIRLVTVSTPFAGIASANHCGSSRLRAWSLGIVPVICQLVTGSKWRDITYSSTFIREPGMLSNEVNDHLLIVTDERESCRRYNSQGRCIDDDFVFDLTEQRYAAVDQQAQVSIAEVKAGHAEIVGSRSVEPRKLIEILQHNGILNPVEPERTAQFNALLAKLYH